MRKDVKITMYWDDWIAEVEKIIGYTGDPYLVTYDVTWYDDLYCDGCTPRQAAIIVGDIDALDEGNHED